MLLLYTFLVFGVLRCIPSFPDFWCTWLYTFLVFGIPYLQCCGSASSWIRMILVSWIRNWNPHFKCGFQMLMRIRINLKLVPKFEVIIRSSVLRCVKKNHNFLKLVAFQKIGLIRDFLYFYLAFHSSERARIRICICIRIRTYFFFLYPHPHFFDADPQHWSPVYFPGFMCP